MKLKKISQYGQTMNYGAGWGAEYTIVYECPCGEGTVTEYRDEVPGFRSHDIFIGCDMCKKEWEAKKGGEVVRKKGEK